MLNTLIIYTIVFYIISWLFPNVTISSLSSLIFASITFAILEKIIKPILKLLLFPINIITLGLFSFLINIFVVFLTDKLVPGMSISSLTILNQDLGYFLTLLFLSFTINFFYSLIKNILK